MNLGPIRNKVRSMLVGKIQRCARAFGVEIGHYRQNSEADLLAAVFDALLDVRRLGSDGTGDERHEFLEYCCENVTLSKAQLFQDLFVLFVLAEKKNGYFVEFGAADGALLSNTYILEKIYGWNGLVAEPAKGWHESLRRNRNCAMDFRCVWKNTGEQLEFIEAGDLSTIRVFSDRDDHSAGRQNGQHYSVETISLEDLLSQHNAPTRIDYLSIDTEGSEYTILNGFDFGRYDISIITVEHNFSAPDRDDISTLLTSKGYKRIFTMFSKWDDWYVKDQAHENSHYDR